MDCFGISRQRAVVMEPVRALMSLANKQNGEVA
jgi:hypothetical protein